jgi:integrase
MPSKNCDKRTGIYEVRYYEGKKGRTKSLKTKDEQTAEIRFQEWLELEYPKIKYRDKCLNDLLKEWILSDKSGESHRNKVKMHWNEFSDYFKNSPITSMNTKKIDKYFLYWREERKKQRSEELVSKTYIHNHFRHLKIVWNWAEKKKYVTSNIFIDINNTKPTERKGALSSYQLQQLINAADDNQLYQNFILFLILTACRLKEFSTLKYEHIDYKYVHFIDSKTGDTKFLKTPELEKIIQEIRTAQKNNPPYLFSNIDGKHFSYYTLHSIVRRYLDKAGFNNYVPYHIRHSVITLWASKIPAFIVKALARHKHLSTTMKYVDETELLVDPTQLNVLSYQFELRHPSTGDKIDLWTID